MNARTRTRDWFTSQFEDMGPENWSFRNNRRYVHVPVGRTMSESLLPSLALFGAGLLVGIGTALLLAPKPGRELRQDVRRSFDDIGSNVRQRLPQGNRQDHDLDPLGPSGSSFAGGTPGTPGTTTSRTGSSLGSRDEHSLPTNTSGNPLG